MPEIVACPDCSRKLRVPDNLLGRKVKCPGCGVNFTASVAGPASAAVSSAPPLPRRDDYEPPPRGDDDYEPDISGKRSVKAGWKRVRAGLNFVAISIWITIGTWILERLGSLLLGVAAAGIGAHMAFAVFILLLDLGSVGMYITGLAFCMGAPPNKRYPVRGLGMTAFILCASFGLFYLLGYIIVLVSMSDAITAVSAANPFGFAPSMEGMGFGLITVGLSYIVRLATFIVSLFYMRAVCQAVKKEKMASTVVTYMLSVGGFVFASIVITVLMWALVGASFFAATSASSPGAAINSARTAGALMLVACGLACVMGLVYLGLFIWYIVLLFQVKGAVEYYIRRL
jgi:hypothetical protein